VAETETVEYYRKRAAQMLEQAETAPTEALKSAYNTLAADWTKLAEQVENRLSGGS
jgi:hypothetical protein